jgi:hypothetical protein
MKSLEIIVSVLTILILAVSTMGVGASAASAPTAYLPAAHTSAGSDGGLDWKVPPDPSTVSGLTIPMGAEKKALLEALEELIGRGMRWDGDIRVSDPDVADDHPEIACRADGTLYVVCDDVDLRNYLDVYESTDHGLTWNYWFSLMGHEDDLTNPSAVIAEGWAPELLIAYEQAQGTNHCELWVFISYLGTQIGNFALIDSYPLDHRNPRICVDYPEYGNWYPYIVYASEVAGEPDYWQIRFRRSFDYGVTWTNAEVLATVFNTGDYGPRPDIDFGGSGLYAAYDRSDPATEKRDILVRKSGDLGANWGPEVGLATTEWDESTPRIGATNGGGAVVVAYDRLYEGPPAQYDIELFYSTDSGANWSWSFLPYNNTDEWGLDLCVSPSMGKIHASYYRFGDIIYTSADHASPWSWASATDINESSYASGASATSITVNPTKEQEACIAWGDTRTWTYEIYFDALYDLGPSSDVAGPSFETNLPFIGVVGEPMSGAGTFLLELPNPAWSELSIHDLSGRRIRTLLDRQISEGSHRIDWDGRNDRGMPVGSGIYYLSLRQNHGELHKRFTLIR